MTVPVIHSSCSPMEPFPDRTVGGTDHVGAAPGGTASDVMVHLAKGTRPSPRPGSLLAGWWARRDPAAPPRRDEALVLGR